MNLEVIDIIIGLLSMPVIIVFIILYDIISGGYLSFDQFGVLVYLGMICFISGWIMLIHHTYLKKK